MGRDVFWLYLSSDNGLQLLGEYPRYAWPSGYNADGSYKYCNETGLDGFGCGLRIMSEGWEMNY